MNTLLMSKASSTKEKKVYPNGYVYEGDWVDGQRDGNGTLYNPLGVIIYQGEWKDDLFHGRGKLINELPSRMLKYISLLMLV